MGSANASILVSAAERCVLVKVSGRANFAVSCDFKSLMEELVLKRLDHLIVDLSECLSMDSTFLGVLVSAGITYSERTRPEGATLIELANPAPVVKELVVSLGVASVFRIIEEPIDYAPQGTAVPAQHQDRSRAEVARTCLGAHELLMQVSPENRAKFKDVAKFLAEDLKRLEGLGESGTGS